ncbi:helicase HerA domain-containing protein [Herbidospora sp. RD11066]
MSESEQRALRAISGVLDWAATAEHAWNPPPFHVDGMHPGAERLISDGIEDAAKSAWTSPLGVVIQGEGGSGKTHLLSWVREQVTAAGGYFFLVDFSAGEDFWRRTARAIVQDLGRPAGGTGAPIQALVALRRIAERAGVSDRIETAIRRNTGLERDDLDALVDGVLALDRRLVSCMDSIRALALYAIGTGTAFGVAHDYLKSADDAGDGVRQKWGIGKSVKTSHDIASELSMLLGLTGPSIVAVDQIDEVLNASETPTADGTLKDLTGEIASGLMGLRNTMHRTLCLVACLPESWIRLRGRAVGTAHDRFRISPVLKPILSEEIARKLVARRFDVAFEEAGFTSDSEVWPIHPEAFATATAFTPRMLLRRVSEHIDACRNTGTVTLLERFDRDQPGRVAVPSDDRQESLVSDDDLKRLDGRFDELRDRANISDPTDSQHEDALGPVLLSAGLKAYIKELGEVDRAHSVDPPPGQRRPDHHARLRLALNPDSDEQRHWTFRLINATNARAASARLKDGVEASGLGKPDRNFIVLRNHEWSAGQATQTQFAQFKADGGQSLPLLSGDIRVFDALHQMAEDADPHHDAWLRSRRPAGRTELFCAVFGPPDEPTPDIPEPTPTTATPSTTIPVGKRIGDGTDLELNLGILARHTAVFAGAGSGKTVFLRRLIEECALNGVSSIVLDPNNDLARLGDRWSAPPTGWEPGDEAKADRYFAGTEVVVWTPGRSRGRPLSFRPLPDFDALRDDPDDLASAIGLAVDTLAPRANVHGAGKKAVLGKAVLREALTQFAKRGGGDFGSFLTLLAALPFEASQMENADQIAAEMGQLLKAATINDPLFAGAGEPMDPAVLLTPSPGKHARVSVISFIGLNEGARPGFVSLLQTALFSWIKRNPARGRPLSGLYVMDEAQSLVPPSPHTEALSSALTLASQARKYGLGLVFATQSPKGVHNKIAGNATTQFIGRINSPAQIAVVQELARARGGRAERVARLSAGQFYAATEGVSEAFIRTPYCLSHHPSDPLIDEEIMQRASL